MQRRLASSWSRDLQPPPVHSCRQLVRCECAAACPDTAASIPMGNLMGRFSRWQAGGNVRVACDDMFHVVLISGGVDRRTVIGWSFD